MKYDYTFDKENCWYKSICPLYDSEECDKNCIRYQKMSYLANASFLTPKQQHPSKLYVEDIDKDAYTRINEIKANVEEFVNNGKNLLIYSKITGNGKTCLSIKILMNYFNKIWARTDFVPRGLFINVPRFLNSLKENIRETSDYVTYIREHILDVDLVVWDEIGVKELTPFEHDYLLSYINARMDLGLSNVFTSNMNQEELSEILGARLFSRVINNSECIELKGSDKRGIEV